MAYRTVGPAISISILAAFLLVAGSDGPFIVAASLTGLNAGTERVSDVDNQGSAGEPVFCKTILTADPRTKNASIFELGLVAIDLALNKSYSTKVKIQSLNESTGDPKLKDSLAFCEAYYEDASYVLGYARSHLNNKQYEAASISAGGVNNDARKCERKLNNPPVKSPFTKENQDLERLSAIIATAANIVGDGQLQSFSPQASVSSSMFPFYFIYHSSYSSID